jgi:hypothetical protein
MTLPRATSDSRCPPRLAEDDRGAIMVMGIFMCVLLVGALWYIAGVGDALIFHERMQEAADSVAFSAAIIEARGMNIIVLMNLLMAAILAIRVAINLVKTVLIVAAGIFTGLACVPWFTAWAAPAAALCGDGAEFMQNLDNSTRTAIDDALIALNAAETGVQEATPAAAWAGAYEMAGKYSPPVGWVLLAGASTGQGWGLPVEKGTTKKLCSEAATGVGDIIASLLGSLPGMPSAAASFIGNLISGISANDFFCELGDGGSAPDFSSQLNSSASQGCQGQQTDLCNKASAAQNSYNSLAAQDGYVDGSPGPNTTLQQQSDVNTSYQAWQDAQGKCDNFDMDQCTQNLKQQQQQQVAAAQQQANSANNGGSGSSGDKRPSMVKDGWHDGIDDAQIASIVTANDVSKTVYSPKFVSIASGNKRTFKAPNAAQEIAWAQAEFFYDCSGAWSSCNNDQNAMWNFRWRARFRLVNPNAYLGGQGIALYEDGLRAKIGFDIANSLKSINLTNGVERANLAKVAADTSSPLSLH